MSEHRLVQPLPVLIAALLLLLVPTSAVADGDPDSGFSGDGKAEYPYDGGGAGTDFLSDAARQDDGKTILVGFGDDGLGAEDFVVSRINADGSLDAGFGAGGYAQIPFDLGGVNQDFANGVAIQDDGKIVVVGSASDAGDGQAAIVRLNPNGSLDTSFSGDGKLVFGVGLTLESVFIRDDGKIAMVGTDFSADDDFLFAQVTSAGVLDPTFGTGGLTTVDFGLGDGDFDVVGDGVLRADGKLLAAGRASVPGGLEHFAFAQVDPAGTLDPGFGKVDFAPISGGTSNAFAAIEDSEGRILASGYASDATPTKVDGVVARLDGNTLDPSFSGDGIAQVPLSNLLAIEGLAGLHIQDNDRIVAAGAIATSPTSTLPIITRFTADGELDTTFGSSGLIQPSFGEDAGSLGPVLPGAGESILVAGSIDPAGADTGNPVALQYLIDQTPPVISLSGPENGSVLGTNEIAYTFGADEAADFSCELTGPGLARTPDKKAFSTCNSPYQASALQDGDFTFKIRATDAVENVSEESRDFTVDTSVGDTEVSDPDVTAKKKQKQKGKVKIKLKAGAQEKVTGVAKGKIKVKSGKNKRTVVGSAKSFKLKKVKKTTEAGEQTVYRLTLKKKKDNKKVLKLLEKGKDLRANPSVKLTDEAGNSVVEKRVVRLK